MLLSTFELLLNASQLPREIMGVPPADLEVFEPVSRSILQGYFLTISNLEDRSLLLDILFTVETNAANDEDSFESMTASSFFDSEGVNQPVTITAVDANTHSIMVKLLPHDTGLLLVQPNPFLLLKPLNTSEIEIRGYVEANVLQSSEDCHRPAKVLLTPEQRGTFYQLDVPTNPDGTIDRKADLALSGNQKLDQIAYSIPTASGGSLFEFSKRE
ncbi:hypothetical protein C1752_01853 [Acaryochloris thomasi RCC1774]|uniref:Uncharacterized protein n=1 Tax=Acaryochloris thomasi RCC1774 TaxID=1764569 RepID=A0A2W1JKI6_9CYAN|nr:hypothetical protein [Acaryochloris thomasi]PZD73910.1 hypothetical protein C1752_01853 [Acaryochloris thomasi RCC1774]